MAAVLQPPRVRIAIRDHVADAANLADGHAMKMRDVRDRRAFHVLDRAAGARFDLAPAVGAGARGDGHESHALARRENLHRQLVEERLRPDEIGKPEAFMSETRRARAPRSP